MTNETPPTTKTPNYTLEEYRKFIRDAAPYISLIAGRRISASEADTLSDDQLTELALKLDERVAELHKNRPVPKGPAEDV